MGHDGTGQHATNAMNPLQRFVARAGLSMAHAKIRLAPSTTASQKENPCPFCPDKYLWKSSSGHRANKGGSTTGVNKM